MSNQINHNPTNDPGGPVGRLASNLDEDTEGHVRALVGEAGAADTEDSRRALIEDADDTEGHVRMR